MSTRLDSLVALSRDRSTTDAERALAASHAARLIERAGGSYLDTYPLGLPTADDDYERVDWDDAMESHVNDALAVATPVYLAAGATFVNGSDGPHSQGFNWSETLTVVRRDTMAVGCIRYVVKDRHGRHGYAFA